MSRPLDVAEGRAGPRRCPDGVEGSPSRLSSRACTKKEVALTVNRCSEPHRPTRWMRSEGAGVLENISRGRSRADRLPTASLLRAHQGGQAERDVGVDGERKGGGRRKLLGSA